MAYKVVKLSALMAYQFGMVEADIDGLSERSLRASIPQGMNYQSLIKKLKSGELVLLSDLPTQPALVLDALSKSWAVSPYAKDSLSAEAISALLDRGSITGGAAGGSVFGSSSVNNPLTPAPDIEANYVPEPVKPDASERPPKLQYEYNYEIACYDRSFKQSVGCHFELAKTEQEPLLNNWQTQRTANGTKYTIHSAYDEPKRLVAKVASSVMGISPSKNVKLNSIGSGVTDEAFIAVIPSVKTISWLGLPTEGYYYHFHQGRLVQEYKLQGEGKWTFYATRSTHEALNIEQGYNKFQSAILVYWRIGGKEVEDQSLVYLEQPITREELDNLNDDWIEQHGVHLDVSELVAVTNQHVEPRDETKQPYQQSSRPKTHIVRIDPSTGSRESWPDIACLYNLSARELLDLNGSYIKDPKSLAVGDKLTVSVPQSLPIDAKQYDYPPSSPATYNLLANSYYTYSEPNLVGSTIKSLNSSNVVESGLPIVNIRDMTPSRVFAKSCNQPSGCINAGCEPEPISNFGGWSLFSKAHANPMLINGYTSQVLQTQMAMGNSASIAGNQELGESKSYPASQLEKRAGTLTTKIVDSYRWRVEGIQALFALQQSIFGDDTQYTDSELRQIETAQSRIRVTITDPKEGEYYPHVEAYHVDDTRIPIKYVAEGADKQLSVVLEENGPTILWTPIAERDPSWRSTPNQDGGYTPEDILVNPIPLNDEVNATVTPFPEEGDWSDTILVFPESSGIAPLYVVYKESSRNEPGVVTGRGKNVEWMDGYWLGKAANSAQGQYIPTKIADALRGKEFKRFSDLQTAIWKEVAKNPELLEQFGKRNRIQILKGNAPFCLPDDQKGGRIRYEIHHVDQIQYGGDVYNIDNLRINTARNHIRIHSNEK